MFLFVQKSPSADSELLCSSCWFRHEREMVRYGLTEQDLFTKGFGREAASTASVPRIGRHGDKMCLHTPHLYVTQKQHHNSGVRTGHMVKASTRTHLSRRGAVKEKLVRSSAGRGLDIVE